MKILFDQHIEILQSKHVFANSNRILKWNHRIKRFDKSIGGEKGSRQQGQY